MNIVEHLATKEPGIFLKHWWRPKVNSGPTLIRFPVTWLQMNANVAPHLLNLSVSNWLLFTSFANDQKCINPKVEILIFTYEVSHICYNIMRHDRKKRDELYTATHNSFLVNVFLLPASTDLCLVPDLGLLHKLTNIHCTLLVFWIFLQMPLFLPFNNNFIL